MMDIYASAMNKYLQIGCSAMTRVGVCFVISLIINIVGWIDLKVSREYYSFFRKVLIFFSCCRIVKIL